MEDFKFITPNGDPEAACALIFNSLGQVLAIKRAGENKLGLPGGKKEEGEGIKACLVRELQEETGLRALTYTTCFARKVPGEKTFFTTTFLVTDYVMPPQGIMKSPEGEPVWVDMWQLCDPAQSPFASYNAELLRSFLCHFQAEIQTG